ncbi:MAG: hypothetical protein KGJ02_06840 [Verrucomicrobiota bacterium]|nr:hypothetical protein [Verrucomicrobiota bacterium]
MMRLRIAVATCGLLCISGLIFLMCERNRYNVVSYSELLTIREKLKALTPQEKQDLAFFIDEVISFDYYPYTLVGYKPMSISNVIVEDTEDLLTFWREAFKRPRNQALRRGYLTWKKYQSLFPRKKHLLVDYSFLGKGRIEIALLCPKLCKATIQEHLNDFREILGKPCTSEEVFWILTHPEHNDFYTIINHTRLVGILLGFGRNNASLYEQYRGGTSRSVTGHQLQEQDPLHMFSNEWPWPGAKLSPNFACDPATEETQQLKKHYKKASKIVHWTYFLRNNLEVTLALLVQD